MEVPGLHHITAITAHLDENIRFYTHTLGMRLVKITVNFDEPQTYHLYYGDALGTPGTLLTFFVVPHAHPGHVGGGQASAFCFSVPRGSLAFWEKHLKNGDTPFSKDTHFGSPRLKLHDPDGLSVELTEKDEIDDIEPHEIESIPAKHAIRGYNSVTIAEWRAEYTEEFLEEVFSYAKKGVDNDIIRYTSNKEHSPGPYIDIDPDPEFSQGLKGSGTIHHNAFRTKDEHEQDLWRTELVKKGAHPTPVVDRLYYRSVYFLEPGGALCEIATCDGPGFTLDEEDSELGTHLCLPPELEPKREAIESILPTLPRSITLSPPNNER